jgi:2-hydroxychromene-2-carboxylate isomerase
MAEGDFVGIKAFLVSRIAQILMGQRRLLAKRAKAERRRQQGDRAHMISYFHQVDDPYSHLAVQALVLLAQRYEIDIKVFLVGPPPDWATPERAFLKDYACLDAKRLAQASGLNFPNLPSLPSQIQIDAATGACSAVLDDPDCMRKLVAIGDALWSGQTRILQTQSHDVSTIIAAGDTQRTQLGHFMSATIHYGGEWYWGLDRLHFLETRLAELSLRRPDAPPQPIWTPPDSPRADAQPIAKQKPTIDFFLSFRSPYTYIATKRAKALADAYGAELRLRFVLPMVMRGLAVPSLKSRYFSLDTAREARRLGIPFGKICDPLGAPVERGYALLPWAIEQGLGYEFCLSFMEHVWSKGTDAGSDAGLRKIVEEAGLNWEKARALMGTNDWRQEAEANRLDLVALGHWGVPCFKLGETTVWGQDRLWVIEDALKGPARD